MTEATISVYDSMVKMLVPACLLLGACAASPREVPALTAPIPPAIATASARTAPVAEPEPRPTEPPYVGPTSGVVGEHAPLVGDELESARGQVVIVHVWASWCAPCAKVMPELQKIYVKYKANGIAVVGISVDDEQNDARTFASSLAVTFPVVWDDDKKLVGKWMPTSMPTTYVVDRAGIVRHVHAGFQDGQDVAILREAEALR